ncbi:S49 family peptidase [Aquabacterium sp. A7-Y]|uniref:S49 family peptidase n=1 Tax=Aquabacterium sp. A7-Y TaxID=1349605 RepID=UPI00223E3D55|nr:S49 family peptidase [Aquabacterium sp. A7-Y]MCW7542099.1 S49 family peptidase [Aquabacterium sp. A7-Y]
MSLPHLASRLYGTPLLIARPKLDVILAVLGSRIGLPETDAVVPLLPPKQAVPPAPGIAVIPIHGTLVRRTMGLEAASGLTSYAEIAGWLDAALADPDVKGILLDIDSPGGEAGGVFELAGRIRAASRTKPVWAHANDAAFSAAYAIGSAARRLTLSQTAGVGSIGVIALHVDQSVKDAKDGLAYRAVYAGHHKNDFSPHAPLTPEAASALQAEVDRLYAIFVASVAQMRSLSEEAVRSTEARLLFGEDAVAAGLADGVAGFDEVVSDFTSHLSPLLRRATGPSRSATASPLSPTSHLHKDPTLNIHEHMAPPEDSAAQAAGTGEPSPAVAPVAPLPATAGVSAADATRHEAQAIAELCLIAGAPERTAEFLAAGFSQEKVRRTLLDARADQPEIASRITADAGTTTSPESGPLMAAVKKLIKA